MNNNYDNGAFDRLDMAISDTRGIIDSMTYASYRHQRVVAPHVLPRAWSVVFVGWEELEERYQREQYEGRA